jgi:outer membrane protein OmpA-like peptidoglycan-associated protein
VEGRKLTKRPFKPMMLGVLLTAAFAVAGEPGAVAPTFNALPATAARAASLENYNIVLLKHVHFTAGHAGLRRGEAMALSGITSQLRQHADLIIELRGYADGTSSTAGDATLSLDRANAVARLMSKAGVAADRILVLGLGEIDPNGPVLQEEHQRVDIRIFERSTAAVPARHETGISSYIQETWGGK